MAKKNTLVSVVVNLDGKISPSFKKVQKSLDKVDKQVKEINKSKVDIKIPASTKKNIDGIGKSVNGLKGNLSSLTGSIPMLGEAMALLANPIAAATAAMAALGTVAFTTASEIADVDKQVRTFTKSVEETKIISDRIRALQKTFDDVDTKELSDAAKTISKEFGISGVEAMKKLETAMIGANGKLDLDNIREYSTQIKALGGDADKLLTTLVISEQEGFYNDKGIDTLKEFGLRIRELPKASADALKNIGVDAAKMQKDINSGAKTQSQAFKEIFGDLSKFSKQQSQQLIADLLGGPGEDLGARGIQILANQSKTLEELAKKNERIQKVNNENLKLTEAQGKATRRLIPVIKFFESTWRKIQTVFFEILDPITEMFVTIGKMLDELGGFDALVFNVKATLIATLAPIMALIKGITFIVNLFRGLIRIVKELSNQVFESLRKKMVDIFGEERIKKWKDGLKSAIEFVKKIWLDFAKSIEDVFEKVSNFADSGSFKTNMEIAVEKTGPGFTGPVGTPEQLAGLKKTKDATPGAELAATNRGLMDNTIGSKVQAEVKQITISIDKLQEIGTQVVEGSNPEEFKASLQQALQSIIADTSQL